MISITELAIIFTVTFVGSLRSESITELPDDITNDFLLDSDNSSNENFGYSDAIFFGILHTLNNFSEWAAREEEIVELLETRLPMLEKELKLIKSYLEDYETTTGKAMEGVKEARESASERGKVVGSSAVLGHRMASRYSSSLARIRELMSSQEYNQSHVDIKNVLKLDGIEDRPHIPSTNAYSSVDQNYPQFADPTPNKTLNNSAETGANEVEHRKEIKNPHRWPNWADKYMSALSFMNMHKTYGYLPSGLRQGLDFDTTNPGHLNALQCAELGMFALYKKVYYVAIEWLDVAKDILLWDKSDTSIPVDLVASLLKVAIVEHNDGHLPEDWTQENYFTEQVSEWQLPHERKRQSRETFLANFALGYEDALFLALCRGGPFARPEDEKGLKCFYENQHPYLLINPIKTEILSLNPPAKQFYEILGNGTIEKIKKLSEPSFELSQLVGTGGLENITQVRTSVGTFLHHEDIPEVYNISEYASGLELKRSSEYSQVVEYTYGRFYGYHSDAFEDANETMETVTLYGDRFATMLFHVNQLEVPVMGGRTPLCNAGIFAHQIRGSAILWYNLYRNGTVRQDVFHGACPVVHGHKIIINNWLRYHGNWDRYKCSLDQFDDTSF